MKTSFLLPLLIAGSALYAQQGYKLDFKIAGLSDTTVYLGNFFGESTYIKDTARINLAGEFSFSGTNRLDEGVYFLVLNKTRLFDVLIGKDQHFRMETAQPNYVASMKISGDICNRLFYENMIFNSQRNKEAKPFVAVLKDSTSTEKDRSTARQELDKISEKVMAHQSEIIRTHPQSLFSRILKANHKIEVPEAPLLPNGKVDSTFGFRYFRAHYWDNFDLSDPAMLRLAEPVYRKKVTDYLDRLFVQQPDTLMTAINNLAKTAKRNPDTYKYLIWTVTMKYQNPEIMGLDEVFVDLYDTYYASGEMDYWANEQLRKNLRERADQLRLSLIGMKAPNLTMLDQNLQVRSLYELKNKYSLIYFYDPDCGHCKKETPKLRKYYESTAFDIGIFAVSADTSMVKMKNYIKEMGMDQWVTVNGPRTITKPYQKLYDALTTPTIYLLNENKKIIAKKLPAEKLEEFLKRYEEIQAAENLKQKAMN